MRKLLGLLILAASVQAAPFIGFYRWKSYGPQRMYAGYTYVWHLAQFYAFNVTCDSGLNNCTSPDYTPTASDTFVIDPDQTPPGGMQNTVLEFNNIPVYKAVNIGTGGNAAGHWNPFQARAKHATAVQVTITSTATVRMFIYIGYSPSSQLRRTVAWPASTSFTYWSGTDTESTCENQLPVTDPVGYIAWPAWSSTGITRCVEITIPVSATPGTYTAGWEYCLDTLATGCAQQLFTITIEAPPQTALSPPASIPALPSIYDTDTLCKRDITAGTDKPGTNCKFTLVAGGTGTAGNTQHGTSYWCQNPTNPDTTLEAANYYISFSNTGGGLQATGLGFYYDGHKVYYQTARWFNNPLWENCGRAIASRYSQRGPGASGFPASLIATGQGFGNGTPSVLGPYFQSGSGLGYWASMHSANQMNNSFPKGFEIGLSRLNGGKYSSTWVPNQWNPQAKQEIQTEIFYNAAGGFNSAGTGYSIVDNRTTAYNFDGYLSFAATGEPKRNANGTLTGFGSKYQRMADVMASVLLTYTQPAAVTANDWGPMGDQSFFVGLELETAVTYWEQTHEPRMGAVIKLALDKMMAEYDNTVHAMPYADAPKGIFCGGNMVVNVADPTLAWYVDDQIGDCNLAEFPELNQMVAWAFAWYWSHWGGAVGGDAYRAQADEMFTSALIGDASDTGNRFTPKAYYQSAKFWYRYLAYRLGYPL